MPSNNETVHISLGSTANHITSHLLNLQGLAATRVAFSSTGGCGGDDSYDESLCDPSVTHDISPVETECYAYATASRSGRYMYVPRALIIDGRNSFGVEWGGINQDGGALMSVAESTAPWSGEVSRFDASSHDAIFAGIRVNQPQQGIVGKNNNFAAVDPLDNFRNSASVLGLSPQFSRFNADPKPSYNAGQSMSSYNYRHVQWDDDEEDDDDHCYGQDRRRLQEERRRQLESKNEEMRTLWNDAMASSFEEAFYSRPRSHGGDDNNDEPTSNYSTSPNDSVPERNIHWHDYFLPPRPHPSKYQVPLPFDTDNLSSSSSTNDGSFHSNANNNVWSSSFSSGYHPGPGGGYNISQSWRESILSEALRKVLEGCDIVKGFNLIIDGGSYDSPISGDDTSNDSATNKYAKKLTKIVAGGGFYGGLATSLLEELQEECRSAGRMTILVDPIISTTKNSSNFNRTMPSVANEAKQVEVFRQTLNAGLTLHNLSSNSDAFLPVSIDGAHRALYGENRTALSSLNRKLFLFEGSAAVALALEASTLFYRLRREKPSTHYNKYGRRSRLGIESGFFHGYSGNTGYDDDANDPFASASNLTYHEFLACARPSSDRRRSVLELDVVVRPISRSSNRSGDGIDIASLLARNSSAMSSEFLQLSLAGIIGGSNSREHFGELHERMMRGTKLEEMRLVQDRSHSSRGYLSSSVSNGPGDWMEDVSNVAVGGGGLLSSLSGNEIAFGRRTDHHHFALLASLRPPASESRHCNPTVTASARGADITSAYLRPTMESMGIKYRSK